MSKIYVVDSCVECPHYIRFEQGPVCLKMRIKLEDDALEIPSLCDLKDYNREAE